MSSASKNQRQLGIIGGMSWASSLIYYRSINEAYAAARGGQHSAPILLASVDFQPVVKAQSRGDWQGAGEILARTAQALERAGAGAFMIASNTMHLVATQVSAAVSIPIINIFDATVPAIKKARLKKIGLLGTRYTMSQPFFREQFEAHGLEVVVPVDQDALQINEIIFRELIKNQINPAAKNFFLDVLKKFTANGVDGVVLGCTEIGLLIKPGDVAMPLFDTAVLHANMGAQWLLHPD